MQSAQHGNSIRIDYDFIALQLLLLTLCLYQLQYIFPIYKSYHFREILIGYLYFRVACCRKLAVDGLLRTVVVFLVLGALVAIHTLFVANLTVAVAGFSRFIHVALVAPLIALIVTNKSQIKSLIYVWMAVVVLGAITIAVQLLGYDLRWLLGDYIALRGGLVRYKSLLGEPNVAGLAGVLFFIFSVGYVPSQLARFACVGVSVFLVIFSLSKSALILFFGAAFVLISAALWRRLVFADTKCLQNVMLSACYALCWIVVFRSFDMGARYISVGANALIGADEESLSAVGDLVNRAQLDYWNIMPLKGTGGGFDIAGVMHSIIGQSFARAGSAAVDLGVTSAILPHNMYLELFLVGGLLLLGVFMLILLMTGQRLGRNLFFTKNDPSVLVASLLIISLYMLGYPNIYEPISGVMLWLIIGAACSRVHAKPVPLNQ